MTLDRWTPPRLSDPVDARMPVTLRGQLENGIRVAHVERNDLPIVDLRVLIRHGASQETVQAAGLASLTADLLAEGAGSRGALEVAAAFEGIGAEFATVADWDCAVLGVHVLADRLPSALALMADVAQRPHMDPAEFARRQAQRVEALHQERSDPARLASQAFLVRAYGPTHRFGRPLHGSPETVQSLSHSNLVGYHRSVYRPAGASVIAVGAISMQTLMPMLERAIGSWSGGPATVSEQEAAARGQPRVITLVDRPGAPQSELRIGHIGPHRDSPDFFPLVVLNTVLGGAFTSRLNARLREEKGYTYGARSGFAFRAGAGPFTVSTAVGADATGDAVADVVDVINGLRREPVPDDELARASNYVALGLARRMETGAAIAQRLTEIDLFDLDHDYFDHYADRIRAVTATEVLDAAQRHLDPDALVIAVAGDRDRIEQQLARLELGVIESAVLDAPPPEGSDVLLAAGPDALTPAGTTP